LFEGPPGTGKTEAVKHLARILKRELFSVNTTVLVDSKLGQTAKNVASLFKEIESFSCPERVLVLFDEIDALALDRTNPNDLREMGRATTEVLKGLDGLNANVILVATTNLFKYFDRALTRRFDFVVNFDCYTQDDLMAIAERMLAKYLSKVSLATHDIRLFKKLMRLLEKIPHPGELQNLIKTSVAFSDPRDGSDYFRRLFRAICEGKEKSAEELKAAGFTVREIGILLQKSKSGIGRELLADKESAE
jgi:AAA+ superfamily predicted ATPase